MSTRTLVKEIIRYNLTGDEKVYLSTEDAGADNGVTKSTIWRHIKDRKQLNGYYFKYGNTVKVREKYKIRKPYYILVADCPEGKNPNVWEIRTCPICGKDFYVRKRYKRIVCSDECHNKYMALYGDEINKNKSKKLSYLYSLKTKEEISAEHEKARETCLKKYGYEKPQQTPEYRDTMSKRFKEKDWSERSKKSNEKLIPKYREICENDDLELLEFRNRFDCTVKCKKCGTIFDVHILGYLSETATHDLCRKCHPNKNTLKTTEPFNRVRQILDDCGIEYYINDRTVIAPYEIDLFISSMNLGFEVNGNYWHSESGGKKDSEYHIGKTKMCYSKGVKLIHIFEDEIINKYDIVKSMVLRLVDYNIKHISSDICDCCELDYRDKHVFFEENHIDGDSKSTYNIGLKYGNEVVCAATFCKRKTGGISKLEIARFAQKQGIVVTGGLSKMIKFLKSVAPCVCEIAGYSDIKWSGLDYTNTEYCLNGFDYVGKTQPDYCYVDKVSYLNRLSKLNFTKPKLTRLGYDQTMTESEIMSCAGYDRIWDCGRLKFSLKF